MLIMLPHWKFVQLTSQVFLDCALCIVQYNNDNNNNNNNNNNNMQRRRPTQ